MLLIFSSFLFHKKTNVFIFISLLKGNLLKNCHFSQYDLNLLFPRKIFRAKELLDNTLAIIKNVMSGAIIDPDRLVIGTEEGLFCLDLDRSGELKQNFLFRECLNFIVIIRWSKMFNLFLQKLQESARERRSTCSNTSRRNN